MNLLALILENFTIPLYSFSFILTFFILAEIVPSKKSPSNFFKSKPSSLIFTKESKLYIFKLSILNKSAFNFIWPLIDEFELRTK